MTGIERLIAKVSNSTTQAMRGLNVGTVAPSWELAELRTQALEEIEYQASRRQLDIDRRTRRRLLHFGCE